MGYIFWALGNDDGKKPDDDDEPVGRYWEIVLEAFKAYAEEEDEDE